MGLGIALLKKGQPGLLGMLALCKVERAAVGLVDPAVCLLWIEALNIIKQDSIQIALVIVGLGQIELEMFVSCCMKHKARTPT